MNVIIVTDGTASEIAELARQVKNDSCTIRATIMEGPVYTCGSPGNMHASQEPAHFSLGATRAEGQASKCVSPGTFAGGQASTS